MLAGVFWILRDSKSHHVSRNILSILADQNNAVVWIGSTGSLRSESSRLCTNPFVNVSRALITIGLTVIFMFNMFFNSQASSRDVSL